MHGAHFVGEIVRAVVTQPSVSVTWAIVPGNSAWLLKNGESFGETQSCFTSETSGTSFINHPIDVQYEVASSEGWPLFVCELWDKSLGSGVRGFLGCGCIWLPSASGSHDLEVLIWKPVSEGLEALNDMLLPSCPDLRAIRELTMSPLLRSQLQTEHVGVVHLKVHTISSGFIDVGVVS